MQPPLGSGVCPGSAQGSKSRQGSPDKDPEWMETLRVSPKRTPWLTVCNTLWNCRQTFGFLKLEASQDPGEKVWFSTDDPRSVISKSLRASVDTAAFAGQDSPIPSPRDAPYGPRPILSMKLFLTTPLFLLCVVPGPGTWPSSKESDPSMTPVMFCLHLHPQGQFTPWHILCAQ